MDALSHILEEVHLRGAEYLYVSGHDRWCFGLQEQTIFHVVLTGSVRLVLPNIEERMLEAGDIVFIPAGAEHRFLHPEATWKPQSLLHEFNGHRNDPVHLGEGLSNTHCQQTVGFIVFMTEFVSGINRDTINSTDRKS